MRCSQQEIDRAGRIIEEMRKGEETAREGVVSLHKGDDGVPLLNNRIIN